MPDPLQTALHIAASGLQAQSMRLRVVSENIANAQSTGSTPGAVPYARQTVSFESEMDRTLGANLVEVKSIGVDSTAFKLERDPGNPAADENGMVKMPNVDVLVELADMREANRSYEANLQVAKQSADMLNTAVSLMKDAGPPGASSNGFNENLALFSDGKCGMWIDATVAASMVTGKDSKVADKVGFALAPDNGLGKRGNWLWAWSLGIPAGTKNADAAQKFISWATSKHYTDLVASKEGIANVPPGTRKSLYANPEYAKIPFAQPTIDSIDTADPTKPTVKPVPYTGVQFVAIPEFQGIATDVGQDFSAALAGTMTVDAALAKAQASTEAAMKKAGYIK